MSKEPVSVASTEKRKNTFASVKSTFSFGVCRNFQEFSFNLSSITHLVQFIFGQWIHV